MSPMKALALLTLLLPLSLPVPSSGNEPDPDQPAAQPSVVAPGAPAIHQPAAPPLTPVAPRPTVTPDTPPAPAAPRVPGAPVAPVAPAAPLRPALPLRAPSATAPPTATAPVKPPTSRTIVVSEDGAATISLSGTSLNRITFPDPILSAYTQTEAIDVTLEAKTAIITFRAPRASDLLVMTASAQYLLRLTPENIPTQSVRIRQPRAEAHVSSSYQTQLASLIEAGYRRQPPQGFRTERPGRPLPITGALAWYLTLQHRGRMLTVQEYAVYNGGAFPHPTDPARLAPLFPTARAISADPVLLQPATWGRVLVIVDTETLTDQPEAMK